MKRLVGCLAVLALVAICVRATRGNEPPAPAKIRVLLTSGGHGFEKEAFFGVFDAMPGIQYTKAEMPKDAGLLKPGLEKQFDVLVMYDMVHAITPEQQQAFVALLRQGIGLVALHHNLGAHRDWPEYTKIIGGKFCFGDCQFDGRKYHQSTYKHGQEIHVTLSDPDHPVTRGLKDFTIHDEIYGGCYVAPDVKVLLTTDHPGNNPQIAWTKTYGRSKVLYLQLGHDSQAYRNPHYGELIGRAIQFVAPAR
jgi:type 1 glutamine amidotransferase